MLKALLPCHGVGGQKEGEAHGNYFDRCKSCEWAWRALKIAQMLLCSKMEPANVLFSVPSLQQSHLHNPTSQVHNTSSICCPSCC
jgi:hypothetical protein